MEDLSDDTVTSVKMAVVGGGGVGKSAMTIMLTENKFVEEYDPTIEEIYRRQITIEGKVFMLDILDTAGQEEYKALRDTERDAFLLVYSITSHKSFEQVGDWYEDIKRIKGENAKFSAVLCGNKVDLAQQQRKVDLRDGQDLAKEWGVPFFETSAKTRLNLQDSVNALCFLERARHGTENSKTGVDDGKKKKDGCILM